jgi:polar amino acid transport system substrate-binding protein
MMQKRLFWGFMALVISILMASTTMAGTLEEIVELRVEVQSDPGRLHTLLWIKTVKKNGSMVEFVKEMAKRMGDKLKVLDFDWDGLIPALLSGKTDILAADMTPTLKRALKISYCDPWYSVESCMFTKEDAAYKTLEDINKA